METDAYTASTREWLNRRYQKRSEAGVYLAHQPIYGLYDANCEPNVLERYLRTYHILKSLGRLQGSSLLDVGASEGYQASLARDLLGLNVACCDLSDEACRRAEEIFKLAAHPADARALPFDDNQFDLITCSETLEHVKDYQLAVDELLRVAKIGVVITAPHESETAVQSNEVSGELHAHINAFDQSTFDYLNERGITVLASRHQSRFWYRPSQWLERLRLSGSALRSLTRPLASLLIYSDSFLADHQAHYYVNLYILLKDPAAYLPRPWRTVRLADIFNHRVPYHHL